MTGATLSMSSTPSTLEPPADPGGLTAPDSAWQLLRPLYLQGLRAARMPTRQAWRGLLREAWDHGAKPWSWLKDEWAQNRLIGGLLGMYLAGVSGFITWLLMFPVTPVVGYFAGDFGPVLIAVLLFWLVGARVAAALPALLIEAVERWRAARFPDWQGLDKATCMIYLAKPTGHEDEPPPAEFRLTDTGKWTALGSHLEAEDIPLLEPVLALASPKGALFAMSLATGAVYFHWAQNTFLAARHEALASAMFDALRGHPLVASVQERARAECLARAG